MQQEIQPSNVVFAEGDFWEVKAEIGPLIEDHYEEIAMNKDKIALNPDWEGYEKVYKAGHLGVYTARFEGKLIGYFVVVASPHMHYKDHVFAVNDIVFLEKQYRKSMVGASMMKFVEEDLKSKGVSVMVVNTKVHQPFDGLMEHLGYELAERIYTKYIGE